MTPPTNVDIVVFALAQLSPDGQAVHLEYIATRAYELAPGAFRWDLPDYADRVDKDKVRVSLTDAQKEKYGALVEAIAPKRRGLSKPTDAWRLTSAGAEWFLTNQLQLSETFGRAQPTIKRGRASEVLKQVKQSELFKGWASRGEADANPYLFADLLGCSPDARIDVVREKFDRLRAQALLVRDDAIVGFLDAAAEANREMVGT